MSNSQLKTLFHFSFAVNDLERARRFYGEVLDCPEGRKLKGRADFNFFGHHIVAHLAPEEVVGVKGRKIGEAGETPLRHFGVVMTLEDFEKTASRLVQHGARRFRQSVYRQRIERLLALPAIAHETCLAQSTQVRRDPRLRNPRDAHQVGHAQLVLAQQRAQPNPALVTEQVEGFDEVRERHVSCYPD